jgi:hypothetical protein
MTLTKHIEPGVHLYTVDDLTAQPAGSLIVEFTRYNRAGEPVACDTLCSDLDDPDAVWMALVTHADGEEWRAEVHVVDGDDSSHRWLVCDADGWTVRR